MTTGEFSEHYIPYLLNRADHVLSNELHRELAERGLQNSDWRILAILHDQGRCSIGQLTEHVRLPQPTITHSINRLAEQQQVKKIRCTEDKRRRYVELTGRGRKVASELVTLAKRYEVDAVDTFSGADDLRRLLTDLIDHVEAER